MANDRFIESPPAGADGWRDVWRENRSYRPRSSSWNWLVGALRGLVRRAGAADADRQRDFNLTILDLLQDLRRDLDQARIDWRRDLEAVQLDSRTADEALAGDLARYRELIPIAAKRNDALIAAIDQKIESVAVRVRDLTNPRLSGGEARRLTPVIDAADFLYRRLEDGLRGSEGDVAASLQTYVDRARDHQPVIDVGCGRGEFLRLCHDAGIEARGCDTNERSVADARARGLNVARAGIDDCFSGVRESSVGSILCAHVVEHLPVESLFTLFRESARVLRHGGLLMIETPNAESLAVSASEFWRDPTHLAPRHPAALVLLGREHGFAVEDASAIHPFPDGARLTVQAGDPEPVRRVVAAINDRLFAPQDLRLILRKS
jgi:O-antigen chain-terminating methyltransferase